MSLDRKPMNIGIVGCGNISDTYFDSAQKSDLVNVAACADLNIEVAEAKAKKYHSRAVSLDEIFKDPNIEMIVNLTIPKAHAEVDIRALKSGKHVYSEKPFALNLDDAKDVMDLAKEKGLRVGCAPDTFLGGGHQTCRKLVDDGKVGKILSGNVCFAGRGHEYWHPNPFFYYDVGGGPMLDMGPYYITVLVNLLGPVELVSALTEKPFENRVVHSQEYKGESIPVRTPTHYAGILKFHSGCIVNVIMSFDVQNHHIPNVELYGTEASIVVPNPNSFSDSIQIFDKNDREWLGVELSYAVNERMYGVIDMASAIRNDRPHRSSGDLAYHVLEVMLAFEESSNIGRQVKIKSTVDTPKALPEGLAEWDID